MADEGGKPMAGAWQRVRRAAAATARATAAACRGTYRAGRTTVQATRRAARGAGRAARRLTHAQGAGRSGLGRLIELTAAHSAGDALVTVALAGTLFFGLPVNQARGQVALYLLVTMAPFAVVAPFVGPVLDRFRSGRRYVMAGTMFARGLLCWALAAAIGPADAVTLFPAALAVLVLSKAYNVSRAAIMPSVLPAEVSLVRANARVTLFALVAAGVAGPVAAGLAAWLGPEWVLRGTTVLFLAGGVAAVRLPRHVDAPDDPEDAPEAAAAARDDAAGPYPDGGAPVAAFAEQGHGRPRRRGRELWRTLRTVGPVVSEAMQANLATRVQSGFLLFFLLFLVQENGLPGPPTELTIAVLAASAGAGGLVSSGVASLLRGRSPELISFATLALATVTAVVAAFLFGLWTAIALAAVAAFAQNLGKLALDAIVQREIAEEVRSSTFGVVESVLQIGWVAGGLAGLLLSGLAGGPTGLGVMAAGLVAVLARLVAARVRRVRTARRYGGAAAAGATAGPGAGTDDPEDPGPGAGDTRPLTRPHG
jgi:MFS family permease